MKLIARVAQFVAGRAVLDRLRGPFHSPKKPGDAGHDLCALDGFELKKGEMTTVKTGVHLHADRGLWYSICARSSFKQRGGLIPFNIIDGEYQGELLIQIFAMQDLKVEPGERIAQIIFFHNVTPDIVQVKEFPQSERGAAGFGSTGTY